MIQKVVQLLRENVIIRASLALSGITCLVKVAGYIEKMLLAYYWGTSYAADAYNAVFAFIISIFVFFREMVEPGFLNNFLKIKHHHGEEEAWCVFFTVLWFILPAGIIISLGIFLFPDIVTHIVLPGFSGDRFALSSGLMKISSIACLFLILSTLTYITLNGYKRFTIAATGDLAFKAAIVICIVLFAKQVGIEATVYGLVIGSVVKLTIHVSALWKNISFTNFIPKSKHAHNIWILTWPLLLGIVFSQISNLVDNIFASYLQEGSISALSYSKKIVELPIVIFPYALSVVIFPYFSELHIKKNIVRLRYLLRNSLKWIAIVFVPLTMLLILYPDTITQLIFQRGAFDAISTHLTAKSLAIYALGMPAFAIETVLVICYFSMADTKTPIFVGIVCVMIHIIITWILVYHMAYLGIAWGLVISKTLKVIILLYLLRYKFHPKKSIS